MVPELDHVMATLLDDLKSRGLLENTLVITLAEFGRTPASTRPGPRPFRVRLEHVADRLRHQGRARATARPTTTASTSPKARSARRELFATIFQALGIDHQKNYHVGARPVPLTDPGTKPVREVLA